MVGRIRQEEMTQMSGHDRERIPRLSFASFSCSLDVGDDESQHTTKNVMCEMRSAMPRQAEPRLSRIVRLKFDAFIKRGRLCHDGDTSIGLVRELDLGTGLPVHEQNNRRNKVSKKWENEPKCTSVPP